MVIATRKPLCNKRWSASPASRDLQLTQLRHPWVATKASCKSKRLEEPRLTARPLSRTKRPGRAHAATRVLLWSLFCSTITPSADNSLRRCSPLWRIPAGQDAYRQSTTVRWRPGAAGSPRYAGPVQDRRRRRPRLLAAQTEWTGNGRYPQISSEVSPASRRYPVCPGVWPGRGHGRIPAITSSSSTPLICAAQFASTRRTSSTLRRPRSLALSNVDVASQ